jgi:hypothetical protein
MDQTPPPMVTYLFTVPTSMNDALVRLGGATGRSTAQVLERALALYELAVTAQGKDECSIALVDKRSRVQTIIEDI